MSLDWHSLGDVQYRKLKMYDMDWGERIKIEDFRIYGAPFGGPLALIRDDKKIIPFGDEDFKLKILIYTSSGKKISEIERSEKKIVALGWNDLEHLISILEDGNVFIYDIFGKLIQSFSLLDESVSFLQILECHFWGDGIVALASDMQLYAAEGLSLVIDGSKIRKYILRTGLSSDMPYTAMAILPPMSSKSGILEVILGTTTNSVIVVDENEYVDQELQDRIDSIIVKMSVTPNGRFLACYRRDGILTVMSSNFATKILDFDTKSVSRPIDIVWCGDDAIVLLWRNTGIVMIGPYGDWLNLSYDQPIHLVCESDCLRAISSTSCELIQRLPQAIESIQTIGSTDPAALLYDTLEAYENGDPKSDENIRGIAVTNQLEHAVETCIQAATLEFDTSKQIAFLKAASYGKTFCPNFDPDIFVDAAKKLRVLNDIRRPTIGLPLTLQQYIRLTPEVLVNRLTIRGHYLLALKICEYLKIKNNKVLVHWASEKVKRMAVTQATDEEINECIKMKLQSYEKITYLEIATAAYHAGRRRLATIILDMEQSAADQVPLLLSMQEEELALQKAINSEDTDLIYLTLFHLERSRTDLEAFHRLVHSHPEAATLLKVFYRMKVTPNDRTLLQNLLLFNKNHLEAGNAAVNHAFLQPQLPKKIQLMKEASQLYGQGRDLTFLKSSTDEHIELLDIQRTLEARTQRNFIDLSITETLLTLFTMSCDNTNESAKWQSEFLKIVRKFRVSEKTVWMIRIQCYCQAGQWDALSKLSVEKKSPIGYKPFALACMKFGQPIVEVEKYVDKITSSEDKYDLYCELNLWRKAMEVAGKLRDPTRLQEVIRRSKDPQIERAVHDIISKF